MSFYAPEHITTVVPGEIILLPVDIADQGGLAGYVRNTEVRVVSSSPAERTDYWRLTVVADDGPHRTLTMNDSTLVQVYG